MMFLVDDLLMAPVHSLLWVFREIHDAAQQARKDENQAITTALSELYLQLETKQITEAEFEAREKTLLDRLERLEAEQESRAPARRQPEKRPAKARRPRKTPLASGKPAALI